MEVLSDGTPLPDAAGLLLRIQDFLPPGAALSAVLRAFSLMEVKWPKATPVQQFFLLREIRQALRGALLLPSCSEPVRYLIRDMLQALSSRFFVIAQKIPAREELMPPAHPFATALVDVSSDRLWEAVRILQQSVEMESGARAFLESIVPGVAYERLEATRVNGRIRLRLVDQGACFILDVGPGEDQARTLMERLRAEGQEALFAQELHQRRHLVDGQSWSFTLCWQPVTQPLQSSQDGEVRLLSGIEIHEQLIRAAHAAIAAGILIPYCEYCSV